MVDAEELARLLAGTALGGRPIETTGAGTPAVRCDAEEIWPAWQAARSVQRATGCWPVVFTSWSDDENPWSNRWHDAWAEQVLNGAAADPWATFATWTETEPATWEFPLQYLVGRPDSVLTEADARQLLAAGATFMQVERLRLERRVAAASVPPDRIPVAEVFTDRDLVWFTPSDQPCAVEFMPCKHPWEALAYVGYHGVDGDLSRHAALVAAAREWHERYGAELVAAWGTMLQFVAARRPTTVDDAWELAGQQLAVGGSLQMDRSDLALALLQTDFWFLHDRP